MQVRQESGLLIQVSQLDEQPLHIPFIPTSLLSVEQLPTQTPVFSKRKRLSAQLVQKLVEVWHDAHF